MTDDSDPQKALELFLQDVRENPERHDVGLESVNTHDMKGCVPIGELEALADGWEFDVGDLDVDDSFRRGQNRMRLLCVQELRSLIAEHRGKRDD